MGTQSERPPGSGIRPQEASEIRPQGSRVSQTSGRPGAGTSPEARGLRSEAFGLKTAFPSFLAIALLAWFLRAADMTAVWNHIRRARMDLVALTLIGVAVTFLMR